MKTLSLFVVASILLAPAVVYARAETPGTDASRGGGKSEAPAPGPQTNAGGPDTVGSASQPYRSDFCFHWKNDPYCKAK